MTLHAKMAMPDLQRYPGNLYLINTVEDVFVSCFLVVKILTFVEKPQMKIISFKIINIDI